MLRRNLRSQHLHVGVVTRETVQKLKAVELIDQDLCCRPLIKLAPVLSAAVKEGTGVLCLCGLRGDNVQDVEAAYAR